jgi:hypothetical protein
MFSSTPASRTSVSVCPISSRNSRCNCVYCVLAKLDMAAERPVKQLA